MDRKREQRAADGRGERPRIGVSACLLGAAVRYDGGHKLLRWLTEELAARAELLPVCPEVELGLGTPREPIRLERHRGEIRLIGVESGRDLTAAMTAYARRRAAALAACGLAGFVLKSKSPSCALASAEVVGEDGLPARGGQGLFAAALAAVMPGLPMVEETALADAAQRADFLARVEAAHRRRRPWRADGPQAPMPPAIGEAPEPD